MQEDHPAMTVARASWAAVEAKDKESWLALLSPDIVVEDPVGEAPTNPTGLGSRGLEEMSEFWDTNIAPNQISFETHMSRVAGNESAHQLTLTTEIDGGMKAIVTGIFIYRVDDDGKLVSLRGYWTMDDMTFC